MLFANMVEEIQRRIEKTEYSLILHYIEQEENEVEQALQLCRERKPAGLLFLGGNPESFKKDFVKVEIPCVGFKSCKYDVF